MSASRERAPSANWKPRGADTFTMTFDSPAPLTVERMAMWTNGYQGNGPVWIVPAHYAKKFHPKYNKETPSDWTSEGGFWQKNMSFRQSTEAPTLKPFKLTKYSEGRSLSWERNPYCYEVTKDGDQLPYVDAIQHTIVGDPQVGKVQMGNGQIDLSFGGFNGVALADVATLKKATPKSNLEVLFWDGGDGTASSIFFSQDYIEKDYRDLFGETKFLRGPLHGLQPGRSPQVHLLRAGRSHHRHDESQGHRVPRERRRREGLRGLA